MEIYTLHIVQGHFLSSNVNIMFTLFLEKFFILI